MKDINFIKVSLTLIFILFIKQFVIFAKEAPSPDWYLNKPIKEIRFNNLNNVSKEELDVLLEEYINKKFTPDLFMKIQDTLFKLDYFEEVNADSAIPVDDKWDKVIIVFNVKEKAFIDKLIIKGSSKIRRIKIKDTMESKVGKIYSKLKVEQDIEALKKLYSTEGLNDVKIAYKTKEVKKKNGDIGIELAIIINEGKQKIVKEIVFTGNKSFKEYRLRSKLKTKKKGFLDSGIFDEDKLDIDKKQLTDFYKKNGYVDFKIIDVKTEDISLPEDKNIQLRISYYLEENEQWFFDSFKFTGNTVLSDSVLQGQVGIKKGKVIDATKVEGVYFKIGQLYSSKGYVFNQMKMTAKRNPKTKRITYIIDIQENGKAYISDIIISGNVKTKDYVIRRELPFKEGDPFDSSKLQEAYLNLYNLRYFEEIKFDHIIDSNERLIDIVLTVKEKRTVEALGGIKLGGESYIGGYINLTEKNLAGMGMTLGGGVDLSLQKQELFINYNYNWLFDTRTTIDGKIYFSHFRTSPTNRTSIPQDVEAPVFPGNTKTMRVADPYKGYFVFSKDTTYNGKNYKAGDLFPAVPTDKEIKNLDLKTDQEYADFKVVDESYMNYDEFTLGVSSGMGYSFITDYLKKVSFYGGLALDWTYIKYDEGANRPFSIETIDSNKRWNFIPRVNLETRIDGRDIYFSPTKGHYFRNTSTFVMGKNRKYFKNESKLDFYFKLADIQAFSNWTWKLVLRLGSDVTFTSPLGNVFKPGSEAMMTDGMRNARGWFGLPAQFIWTSKVEFRMPIMEKFVWFDIFFDAMFAAPKLTDLNIKKDWYFTAGFGFRSSMPQLPLGLYFGKLFYLDKNGNAKLHEDNIVFNKKHPTNSMAFILTFGLDF